jgi:coniferyl-aldehyde dehydrogenase
MVINDVRCQLFYEQLPFGGVGMSGSGRYRGHEGFRTFSNAKTVLRQMDNELQLAQQRPPYTAAARQAISAQIEALRIPR